MIEKEESAMPTIMREKSMPKTLMATALMVLCSSGVLGALMLVNGGEAWGGSLGPRAGVGTSAGVGGGAAGVGPGAPGPGVAGAPGVGRAGVGTSAGVGGGAVGVGPGAPARGAAGTPVAAPAGYVH